MKIMIEDSKRCNIAMECKRLKTASWRRGVKKGFNHFNFNFLKSAYVCNMHVK